MCLLFVLSLQMITHNIVLLIEANIYYLPKADSRLIIPVCVCFLLSLVGRKGSPYHRSKVCDNTNHSYSNSNYQSCFLDPFYLVDKQTNL